jgi:hypothetical protein
MRRKHIFDLAEVFGKLDNDCRWKILGLENIESVVGEYIQHVVKKCIE